jgi:hypothetical protein
VAEVGHGVSEVGLGVSEVGQEFQRKVRRVRGRTGVSEKEKESHR